MRRVRLPIGHATGTSALPLPHKYLREKGARAWIRRLFNSTSKTRYLALRALTAEYDAQVKAAEDARNKEELYSSDMLPYVSDEIDSVMLEDFSVVISGAQDVASLPSGVRARSGSEPGRVSGTTTGRTST
jgi:hypothetical protein